MKTILFLILGLFAISCQDYYKDGGLVPTDPLKINSLEFIKSRPDLFDTTLMIIEKSGLADVISSTDVTFFVPQKKSITNALNSINSFVKNKRDSLGYTKDTVLLDDVPNEKWAEFLSHYIFRGKHLRDEITKGRLIYDDNKNYISGGEMQSSLQGYPMMLLCNWTDWEGVAEAGPRYIYLVDTKGTDVTDPEKAKYTSVSIITSNILTSSGTIHVLSKNHEFGFGNSSKFIPAK